MTISTRPCRHQSDQEQPNPDGASPPVSAGQSKSTCGVLGWRVYEHFDQPAVGDRYEVTFTVNRMCAAPSMESDGPNSISSAQVLSSGHRYSPSGWPGGTASKRCSTSGAAVAIAFHRRDRTRHEADHARPTSSSVEAGRTLDR